MLSPCSVFTFRNCQIIKSLLQITVTQRYETPLLSWGCQPESYVTRTLAPHQGDGGLTDLHSPEKGIKIIWTVGCDPSLGYETTCRQHSGRAALSLSETLGNSILHAHEQVNASRSLAFPISSEPAWGLPKSRLVLDSVPSTGTLNPLEFPEGSLFSRHKEWNYPQNLSWCPWGKLNVELSPMKTSLHREKV